MRRRMTIAGLMLLAAHGECRADLAVIPVSEAATAIYGVGPFNSPPLIVQGEAVASDGMGPYGNNMSRGALSFDLASLPTGSTIDSATLTLDVSPVYYGGGGTDLFASGLNASSTALTLDTFQSSQPTGIGYVNLFGVIGSATVELPVTPAFEPTGPAVDVFFAAFGYMGVGTDSTLTVDYTPASVPEPASVVTCATGLLGAFLAMRREASRPVRA